MRILLVDDHALFRSGLRHVLADLDPELEIDEAGSRDEALQAMEARQFDLVLTDLLMPGMDKASGIAAFKARFPKAPIIVISMLDGPTDIRAAVAAGATGFIPKSSTPEIMIEAIRLVLAGGVYLPPAVLHIDPPAPAGEAGASRPLGPSGKQLTERQKAVLAELAQGKSNKEIAQSLNLSEATVKVHLAAIMRSLDVRNRTQAVLTATDLGLLPGSA